MDEYTTETEAINALAAKGYTESFSIENGALNYASLGMVLHPEDFEVVEAYRFEGITDPGDMSAVYAIESKDGKKGVLVMAYGPYSEPLSADLIQKLDMRKGALGGSDAIGQ
ncbi:MULTISPECIES: phosphoribosylpyrophosphate synthetase [Siphonobacter]|uniref:Phosphoribosylpyrophosphate synthetase n=1 Tax=Siphonobacter curvatus TaxID=2094562 RepID=A0A2S7ING5_9BACT|nr:MULTISPECIES: phosphoribosylpyrophosphate synthetase [Siphonobacter]PMD97646.1 phosphoribosylpyrophosphate synthetase [Siphonobacter sp. BAB-5405]PQA59199.1 phosphoribosylpyrophosphate synthetase [Siphonobacter curvatus]